MKRILLTYILPAACAMLGVRCTEDAAAPEWSSDLDEMTYTSYWYYTYEALDTVDYETLGLETAAAFKPYAVAERGDTLFVANSGTAGNSLILYSKKAKKPLKTISTWTVNDTEKNFMSTINAIVPTADRLYITEITSFIHVFSLPDMEYLTCIGTGSYNAAASPVCNVQALAVKDGLIYARDKPGTISIYKESDVTPENYQKIKRYKQAGPGAGDSSNNGFAAHYMEADAEGHILLTGYNAKSIRVLDPTLVDDDFVNGTNLDIDALTWTLPFNPKTFATSPERMYATGSNDALNIYDYAKKEWVKTFKTVKGYAFTKPERIYGSADGTFWISDVTKCALVQMGVFKGEIREYEPINKTLVKVRTARTRSGEEQEEFYVDLRTHEIADPAEAE